MDTMIMWGGYAAAAIVAGVAAVMLQKKGSGNSLDVERAEELFEKLSSLEKELSEAKDSLAGKEQKLKAATQERDEKASALEALENDFESKMDDVVQSSIQKISHAEQAKEEAVKAAGDNYEAAAEAYAKIKEKEKIIAELQKRLDG
jgi:DNA repair exonuclease SbcCD ATPase subunit